ncbi:MAG: hypothetical protein P8Y71_19110, partial [Pseudolabrys sp.]
RARFDYVNVDFRVFRKCTAVPTPKYQSVMGRRHWVTRESGNVLLLHRSTATWSSRLSLVLTRTRSHSHAAAFLADG